MMDHLKNAIRNIPDFPVKGVLFRDITPLLENPSAFKEIIHFFRERYQRMGIDKIAAVESRGFIFGAPLACELECGLALLRKPGKLPSQTIKQSYSLEYGDATIEAHTDSISKGEKVLILDDLLATGGTASAAVELVRRLGGNIAEVAFVIELRSLAGRAKLPDIPVFSLLQYD